jgi:hypothetical protein
MNWGANLVAHAAVSEYARDLREPGARIRLSDLPSWRWTSAAANDGSSTKASLAAEYGISA